MKNLIFVIAAIILLSCQSNKGKKNTQDKLSEVQKLEGLCKLWGFLKYYHPEVAQGQINWDSVLVTNIPKVRKLITKREYLKILDEMIPSFHNNNKFNTDTLIYRPFVLNVNFDFLTDTCLFGQEIIEKTQRILMNKIPFKNRYIQRNEYIENPNLDFDTLYFSINNPEVEIRLLSLFRYWNIINYYYPYKYLIDNDWNKVLVEFIPRFIKVNDFLGYHLLIRELLTNVNDNHVYSGSEIISHFFGKNYLPVEFRYIEGEYVISQYVSDSLARVNNLKLGDIILEIEGEKIKPLQDSLINYIAGSNDSAILNKVCLYLKKARDSIVELTLKRGDSIINLTTKSYIRDTLYKYGSDKNSPLVNFISDEIVYINLGQLEYESVDSVIKSLLGFNKIIFDLRNNCRFIVRELCNILFPKAKSFYAALRPDYSYPGLFHMMDGAMAGPRDYNQNYFRGQLIILINENTQSIGEFTTMALMQHPDTYIVGSNSAGTDGDVSIIYLPGGIRTNITGIGIYYPDFRITQRVGIIPDKKIKPSIYGIKNNIDEVLNGAINYCNKTIK